MLYKVTNKDVYLGTFETVYPISQLRFILCKVFDSPTIELKEMGALNTGFKHTYYVYSYNNQQFDDVLFLGSFDTNLSIHDSWDILVRIFDKDNEGIFVRKEKIIL